METCLDRLEQYLIENRIYYEVQEHRSAFTMQEVAAALHERGSRVAKVLIARADGQLIMLVLPAPLLVDFDRAGEMLGCKQLQLVREREFARLFPDCDVGAMPPFGNFYDMPVYLDDSLAEQPYLVFQAGTHQETMKIAMSDYLLLVDPKIGDFACLPEHEGIPEML
jgi:Ala-tRNA(Pro) deacylase